MKKVLIVILLLLAVFAVIFVIFWQLSIDRSSTPENTTSNVNVTNVENQVPSNQSPSSNTVTPNNTSTTTTTTVTTSDNTNTAQTPSAQTTDNPSSSAQLPAAVQADVTSFINAMQTGNATEAHIDAEHAAQYASDTNLITQMLQGRQFINQNGQVLKNVGEPQYTNTSDGVDWYTVQVVYTIPNRQHSDMTANYRIGTTSNGLVSIEFIRQ